MKRRPPSAAVPCALLVLLAACGKDEPAEAPPPPTAAAAPTAAPAPPPEPEPEPIEYFTGVVRANGLPQGVAPLKPIQTVRRRHVERERVDDKVTVFRLVEPMGDTERSWRVEKLGDDWWQVEEMDSHGRKVRIESITEAGRAVDRRTGTGERLEVRCARFRRRLNDRGNVVEERCRGDNGEPREDSAGVHVRKYEVNATGYVTAESAFDAYGTPVPLAPGRAERPPEHAVFTRRFERNAGGQAVEESSYDRAGSPTEDEEGRFRRARTLDDAGRTTHEVDYGLSGDRTGGRDGIAEVRWLYADGKLKEVGYLDAGGKPVRTEGGYFRILFELDERERVVKETYADADGNAVPHRSLGVPSVRFGYDDKGRRVSETYLDAAGQPATALGRGHAGIRREYDDRGLLTAETRLGVDGKPAHVEGSWTRREQRWDSDGRLTEERYADEEGKPVTGPEGWAIRRTNRAVAGDDGTQADVTVETLGPDEKPVRAAGAWHARVVERYDAEGRRLSRAVFDAKGAPTVEDEGRVHLTRWGYDEAGDHVRTAWLDGEGQPTLHAAVGAASERISRNKVGRETQRDLFGVDGAAARGAEGWAVRALELDDQGRLVETRYLDGPEQLVGRAADGVARERRFYGGGRELRQITWFGADDKPIYRVPGGYVREVFEIDPRGRLEGQYWLELGERLALREDLGYARVVYGRDGLGRITEERYQNADKMVTLVPEKGYAGVKRQYDAEGRLARETLLGEDTKPAMTPRGYAQRLLEYLGDSWTLRAESYLDAAGRPAFHRDGYAALEREVDPRGHLVRVRHLDALGNPVADREGAAEKTWTWQGDRLVSFRTLGPNGEPVPAYRGGAGFDRVYDAMDRVVRETLVDQAGAATFDPTTGCASVTTDYDAAGEVTRVACLDATDQPWLGVDGWAARADEYDEHGWRVQRSLYDTNDELLQGPDGWAREITLYDERGRVSGRAWVGADGAPAVLAGGYSGVKLARDDRGRVARETYLDAVGEPVLRAEGWASRTFAYDGAGRVLEETFLDLDEEPVRVDGYATKRTSYDPRGVVVERRYLGPDGQPVVGPGGWAIERLEHDARGRLMRKAWFDAAGEPGRSDGAWVEERYVRDRFGRLREVSTVNRAGQPANRRDPSGRAWAIEKLEYDGAGRKSEQSWFDEQGRPAAGPEGVHRVKWTWNEQGLLVGQQRYVGATRPAPGGWARQGYSYDQYGRLSVITYQDELGRPAGVWNSVGQVRLAYGPDGRLVFMTYLDLRGQPTDARVCYPGAWCEKKPVHEARYVYGPRGDEPIRMELRDKAGRVTATLDCDKGVCF